MNKKLKTISKSDREYLSHVTLMILSKDLEPDFITNSLKLKPDQQWKKGERQETKTRKFKTKYKWGGWKKYLPKRYETEYLEEQLIYWYSKLKKHKDKLLVFKEKDYYCCLDCFVTTNGTASITFNDNLLKMMSEIGLEIRLSYWSN